MEELYGHIFATASEQLRKLNSLIYRISMLRVALFVVGIAACFILWGDIFFLLPVALCTFVPFLALIKYHNSLFVQRERLTLRIRVCKEELAACGHDDSAFGAGDEFIDSSHHFSFDLDVFGVHSLYQHLNRTTTAIGARQLAEWLQHPLHKKVEIEARQAAVCELAGDISFLIDFRVAGLSSMHSSTDEERLTKWAQTENSFLSHRWISVLPFVAGSLSLIAWLTAILSWVSYLFPLFLWLAFATFSFGFTRRISRTQETFERYWKIIRSYAEMLSLIELHDFKSLSIKNLQGKFLDGELPASASLRQLSRKLNTLDQRNNILVTLLLNGLFFWELYEILDIERWKLKYGLPLLDWIQAIGKMEAFCGLATFAIHHPKSIYPTVSSAPFVFEATEMGHPLMSVERCVKNGVTVTGRPCFLLITGANMAGKSTYLRTVGVNYLLACIGAPVCAETMTFYPASLFTAMRTSDSLSDNESYFFAELKRLSCILTVLKGGEELFIILDEILRGTNSVDKQRGSFALIKQFIELGATGILATHDLQVARLAKEYPKTLRNFCFEAEIQGDELSFNYKMSEGIAKNMNACFLMKKMGFEYVEV